MALYVQINLQNEVKVAVYRKRRNMKAAFNCLKVCRNGKDVVLFSKWKQLIHFMKPTMNPIQVVLYWRVVDEEEKQALGKRVLLSVKITFRGTYTNTRTNLLKAYLEISWLNCLYRDSLLWGNQPDLCYGCMIQVPGLDI